MRALADARNTALLAVFVDVGIAGVEFPATPELARRIGCSQQQVERTVARLRDDGRIRPRKVYRPEEGQHATRREIDFLVLPLGCLAAPNAPPRRVATPLPPPAADEPIPPPSQPRPSRGKTPALLDTERVRALLLAAKPLTLPPSWGCQFINSEDVFPPVYCGARRCHPDSAYCDVHYDRTHRSLDEKYRRKSKSAKELADG